MIRHSSLTVEDVLAAAWRRLPLVLLVACAITAASLKAIERMPLRFESEVRIQLVPASVTESYIPSAVRTSLDARLPAITEQVLDGDRLRLIVRDLGLYRSESAGGDMANRIRRDFQLRVAGADSFVVVFTARDAVTARAGAQRLGVAFLDESQRRAGDVAEAAARFIDVQLDDTRRRLEERERALAEFNQRNAGELPSQVQSNLQQLQAAQTQVQALNAAIDHDREEQQGIDRSIQEPTSAGGRPDADAPAKAPSTPLQAAERELTELQARLQPEHPDVVRLKRRIAELDVEERTAAAPKAEADPPADSSFVTERPGRVGQLHASRDRLERLIDGREAEVARLRTQIAIYTRRLEAAPGRENEMTSLMRDYATLKDVYTKLLAKKEEASISARLQTNEIGERFVLVSPAQLPARPVSPNRPQLTLVGLLSGMILAVGLAALLEYRDTSVRSEQDVTFALGVPTLASIPLMLTRSEQRWHRIRASFAGTVVVAVLAGTLLLLWWSLR